MTMVADFDISNGTTHVLTINDSQHDVLIVTVSTTGSITLTITDSFLNPIDVINTSTGHFKYSYPIPNHGGFVIVTKSNLCTTTLVSYNQNSQIIKKNKKIIIE